MKKPQAERPTHQPTLELREPIPSDVEIGTNIVVKVQARCPRGCDLRGHSVSVLAGDATLASGDLVTAGEAEPFNETDDITVTAPASPGEYTWSLVLAGREAKGVIHADASRPLSFRATPHATSLAVWEIPSPVVIGASFTIKIGARSSGACELKGAAVEVRNQDGERVAGGALGDTPWTGTTALYWTDVEITAPSTAGVASWSVAFAPTGVDVPHNEGSAAFSFAVVKPPQHTVTVTVVEKESGDPIEGAYVRMGPHRGSTDECGVAKVGVPAGTFDLIAWKGGYLPPSATVEVAGDVSVQLEAEIRPEDDPWASPV